MNREPLAQPFWSPEEVGREIAGDLAAYAAGLDDARDDDVLFVELVGDGSAHYSRISSTKRFFIFMPAPRRMDRMARAVRPCLPGILR